MDAVDPVGMASYFAASATSQVMTAHFTRRVGLDFARVVAIGLVILCHFSLKLEFLGIFGVELFFALSGFLIGGILYKSLMNSPKWSFDDVWIFWLRRWYRTLPNYFLFLFIALVFHSFFGGLPSPLNFLKYPLFLQNLMSGENAFYGVSWSLAVEEWFYFTFPLVILMMTIAGLNRRTAFLCTTFIFLLVPPVLREYALKSSPPDVVRLMTLPRLDAIFYGVAMAFLVAHRGMGHAMRRASATLGLAGILVFMVIYGQGEGDAATYRVAFIALPFSFALILPWLQTVEIFDAKPRLGSAITSLGLWSYSMYLSHIPVLFTVYALFGSWRDNILINLLSKIIGLCICILVSRFIYMNFETRFTAMRPAERFVPRHASSPTPHSRA